MIKRVLDIVISVSLLCILLPIMVLLGLLIKIKMGSPIFFRQTRPGFDAKPFDMIKFRTMLHGVDADGGLLPDSLRLTRMGSFLRASSLDELPELWNVLKGDMSLVGPRPLLMEYLPLYSRDQMRRHEIKPGITGWAQVNGRNELTWGGKFALDVWYVDNHSLWLDLKILLLTVKKVLFREGVTSEGSVSAEKFMGNTQ